MREAAFDEYQKILPRPFERDGIVRIVAIDDASIAEFGQWPWPRTYLAEMVDRLASAGVAAIAFDIVLPEADRTSPRRMLESWQRFGHATDGGPAPDIATLDNLPDHDAVLAAALGRAPAVLGIFLTGQPGNTAPELRGGMATQGSDPRPALVKFRGAIQNLAPLTAAAAGIGNVSLTRIEAGTVRRVPMMAAVGDAIVPALSMEALRVAQKAGSYILRSTDASGETDFGGPPGIESMRVGQLILPLDADGTLRVRYAGSFPERYISARDVLSGPGLSTALQQALAGRIVLVGATTAGLRDLVATPLVASTPGVEVHAEIIEQAVAGTFLIRPDWAPGAEFLVTVLLSLTACALVALGWQLRGLIFAALATGGMVLASWLAFRDHGLLLGPILPAITLAGTQLVGTAVSFFGAERTSREIRRQFEHFVAPQVIEDLVADPAGLTPGGARRELAVLFLDVRGFSTITERMAPEEVIAFINDLMTPLTDRILDLEGTVDKYMGDAIMAFWNAPRVTENMNDKAVQAALGCLDAVDTLAATFQARGMPPIGVGIGINTGDCSVGNMGSTRRLAYTCVGDAVNLASRLEGLTRRYGIDLIIGDTTASGVTQHALIELDLVAVKGRARPERVWAVAGGPAVRADPSFDRIAGQMSAALAAYRSADWPLAARQFQELRDRDPVGRFDPSRVAVVFLAEIDRLRSLPPDPDWSGIFRASSKTA